MDEWRVAAGAVTGFVVGMTGVGGGALMTPLLLLAFGVAPQTAVATDLWFAAITKVAVSGLHVRQGLIDWAIVGRLWMGSLPASALTLMWMAGRGAGHGGAGLITLAIGAAVCVTAIGLLADAPLRAVRAKAGAAPADAPPGRWTAPATTAAGAAMGAIVTLTSVGAGALGVVVLVHLYRSRLTPPRLVATDIAHAVPLALCAGAGHLALGGVDAALLRDLLAGSIPAALAGALLSSRVPHAVLRTALGAVLLAIGVTMLATR